MERNLNPFLMDDAIAPHAPSIFDDAQVFEEEIEISAEPEEVALVASECEAGVVVKPSYISMLDCALVFAVIALFLTKSKHIKKIRNRAEKVFSRSLLLFNVLVAVLAYYMFAAPAVFGIGRAGELGLLKIALFVMAMKFNAGAIAHGVIEAKRARGWLWAENFWGKPGIVWFRRGIALFASTVFLFLILTESVAMWGWLFVFVLGYAYVALRSGVFGAHIAAYDVGAAGFFAALVMLGVAAAAPWAVAFGALGLFKMGSKNA
ncbi:MAG: hypothetical protein FWD15_03215 [Alphaproteobacteria bacterium]|nr:hypothetical protein [Alphaproteobacteria bacterium]